MKAVIGITAAVLAIAFEKAFLQQGSAVRYVGLLASRSSLDDDCLSSFDSLATTPTRIKTRSPRVAYISMRIAQGSPSEI